MEKFIPYEKLSKKEQRRIDRLRRNTWGEMNPVTRKSEHSAAYNRSRENRRWKAEAHGHGSSGGFVLPGLAERTERCYNQGNA